MKLFERMLLVSILVLLVAIHPVWAAGGPPETRDCDTIDPSEYNARLDCKTENVNSALFGLVDRVIEFDQMRVAYDQSTVFTEEQKNNFLTARERAQNAKNRTNAAEGFKGAVKKQKSQDEDCYIKELSGAGGDGDGVCEKNETCEEVIGDNIGNDDSVCTMKGNEKEVCVQICQQPLLDDDDNYDPEALGDMEEELTEFEGALNNAGKEVEMLMMAESRLVEQGVSYEAMLTDSCGDFSDSSLSWQAYKTLQGFQIAKNSNATALDTCSVVCNQDTFGWNCEAACLIFAISKGVLDGLYDGYDLRFNLEGELDTAAQMEKLAQCVQNSQKNAQDASDALIRVEAELALLKVLVEQTQALLLTPHGQRDGFPTTDGNGLMD